MKITINAIGTVTLETENQKDYYTLGRIAANFKVSAQNYPEGQKSAQIAVEKVLEKLSE